MEATIKLNKMLQNPEGRELSFNIDLISNLIITSKANGEIYVTLRINEELEDAYVSHLRTSLGI